LKYEKEILPRQEELKVPGEGACLLLVELIVLVFVPFFSPISCLKHKKVIFISATDSSCELRSDAYHFAHISRSLILSWWTGCHSFDEDFVAKVPSFVQFLRIYLSSFSILNPFAKAFCGIFIIFQ